MVVKHTVLDRTFKGYTTGTAKERVLIIMVCFKGLLDN